MRKNGASATPPGVSVERDGSSGSLVVACRGDWGLEDHPAPADALRALEDQHQKGDTVRFDISGTGDWDSSLIMFLLAVRSKAENLGLESDFEGLPRDARQLVQLALAVPPHEGGDGTRQRQANPLARLGQAVQVAGGAAGAGVRFVGEFTFAVGRLARGRIVFRRKDFGILLQECGSGALPIVGLLAALTGLIFAFVGAVQLQQFGAEIYVADLVGIAMAREMGALMAGIIMAGRSGAAFAAHIGSMKANEEIDALTTLGIQPMDYLVTPRAIALVLMMPLLTLYADLLGILGGMAIGITMLDLAPFQYWQETREAVTLEQISVGLVKSVVYALIIAISGCYYGMRSGRNAAAVGRATTSAVVSAIVWIVVADSIPAVVCDALGI